MTSAIDPKRCPICGEPNACGGAEGAPKCWCWDETIPAEALARIPAEAKDRACICKRCAAGSEKPISLLQQLRQRPR